MAGVDLNTILFGEPFTTYLTRFRLGNSATFGLNFESPSQPIIAYMDGVMGNVGIATNAPTAKLHVTASGTSSPALQLENGAIKVSGAAPTAFKHVTASGNVSGNLTTIPNTTQANASTDILIVTHQFIGAYLTEFGVWWNGSNWTIYTEDASAMPTGESFNVLVIKQ